LHHSIAILEKVLVPREIVFPDTAQLTALQMLNQYTAGTSGAVDSTLIRREIPTHNQRNWYSAHKHTHALKAQFVTGPNGIILHVAAGYPGAMSDMYVLCVCQPLAMCSMSLLHCLIVFSVARYSELRVWAMHWETTHSLVTAVTGVTRESSLALPETNAFLR
jgi:hypothetical protein